MKVRLILLLLICLCHPLSAAERRQDPPDLKTIDAFALGGVGVAGTESPGERAFRSALQKPDALTLFNDLLKTGTREAQLYALCGFRLLAPDELKAKAAGLTNQKAEVQTMRGCIIGKEPMSRVITQICDGTFDPLLKSALEMTRSLHG